MLQAATTYPSVVGRVLAYHRDRNGLSQAQLADAAGMAQSTWSKVERGDGSITLEQLRSAARAMHKKPAEILEEAEKAEHALSRRGVKVHDTRVDPSDAVAMGLGIVAVAVVAAVVIALLAKD